MGRICNENESMYCVGGISGSTILFTELIVSETGWNAPTTWDVSVMIGDDFTHVPDRTFYNILYIYIYIYDFICISHTHTPLNR